MLTAVLMHNAGTEPRYRYFFASMRKEYSFLPIALIMLFKIPVKEIEPMMLTIEIIY